MSDRVTSNQNNYYLRKSLSNELATNLKHIEEFAQKVQNIIDKPQLVLDTFVWESMIYSRNALETPTELLAEAQKFYRSVNEIMGTAYYNNTKKVELLRVLSKHMEAEVFPKFASDLDGLKKLV